jgi:hypothetical protein
MCKVQGKNGESYSIEIDDSGCEIKVYKGDRCLGGITLSCHEEDLGNHDYFDVYTITHMDLGESTRNGLGRKCLELHKEKFQAPILAGPNDGSKPEDGSYLIDDGPGFIEKMREEGIVCRDQWDGYNES